VGGCPCSYCRPRLAPSRYTTPAPKVEWGSSDSEEDDEEEDEEDDGDEEEDDEEDDEDEDEEYSEEPRDDDGDDGPVCLAQYLFEKSSVVGARARQDCISLEKWSLK
jgi:hypothetical protein